ncbi:zinc finger MYM-type 1-like [Pelobates cultripes]|uniref:Zinc finger MYM-type 1-like n=1 Tax=Pelobates cultripes TaxID=61616 RepID=A0AAD1WRV7_PELCU|nr:zinc finger MYM-type 1-like [Pelobates cultripes]
MSKPLSGAQKRKKKQELEEKICRIPKITGFLLPTSGSSAQPSACGSSKEHASTCSQEEIPPQSVSEYGSEVNTVDSSDQPMSLETTPVPMEVEKPSFHNVEIQDATAEAVDIPPKSMEKSGFLTDIGLWPNSSTLEMREYWSKNGNSSVRKPLEKLRNEGFPKSFKDGRCCTADMFLRNCPNGDKVERKWLCYSNNTGRIYCFDCKLFSSSTNAFSSDGFSDWKHASERISSHEQSQHHIRAVIDTAKFSKLEGRIDYKMQQQIEELTTYGQNLVKRLLSVIVFLAERGLAFRGDDQTIGSPHNGNYLGILELLSEYDAFLAQHIQTKANKGKGCTSYLSANVCEELIQITGDKILEVVISHIKMAKYYSVSVDSAEDSSHTDQLTVIIRYLEENRPVERFVTFLPSTGHKGEEMADALLAFLNSVGLTIQECRGQSYDNASNMSGHYKGMQARILNMNKYAKYIPCFGHSLNLVGKDAANSCSEAVRFFNFVQALYTFFSGSTRRYKKLKDQLDMRGLSVSIPKKLSDTRWSCRADACQALVHGYDNIMDILFEFATDIEEKSECRNTAKGLFYQISKLETGIFAEFWNTVLQRFNSSSKTLQSVQLNLNAAVGVLKSLKDFINEQRTKFDAFEEAGKRLTDTEEYIVEHRRLQRRNVRQQPLDYGHSEEAQLTPKEAFYAKAFLPCVDKLLMCLEHRLGAYSEVCDLFGFLINFPAMDSESINIAAEKLSAFYKHDLGTTFGDELIQFQSFISLFLDEKPDDCSIEQFMYNTINDKDVRYTFPNTEIALKIYLTLMISNSSGERSFSKMKLIKNLQRTTMSQSRLTKLSIMSAESDILRVLDFSNITKTFAAQKARRLIV